MPHNRGLHRELVGSEQDILLRWPLLGQGVEGRRKVDESLWRSRENRTRFGRIVTDRYYIIEVDVLELIDVL